MANKGRICSATGCVLLIFVFWVGRGSADGGISAAAASAIIAGATLTSNTIQQIAQSSATVRSCAIEIRNFHKELNLVDPAVYVERGAIQMPPAPFIRSGYKEACLFRKSRATATGTFGVLQYKLQYIGPKYPAKQLHWLAPHLTLDIMWGVPYSGTSTFTLGINKNAQSRTYPNFDMMEKMYEVANGVDGGYYRGNYAGQTIVIKTLIYGYVGVHLIATMSTDNSATMIINIGDINDFQ